MSRNSGSAATIILLIRASTDLICFFTWQEHWASAIRLSYPGCCLGRAPWAVMELDEGWLQASPS